MVQTRKKIIKDGQVGKQKSRKQISIEQKLNILKKLENGSSISKVAKLFELPKSTIDTVKANREKILECGRCLSSEVAETTMRTRNSRIHKTETLLHTWIVDQREKGATLNENLIRDKALSIFQDIKSEKQAKCNFLASHGWFENYKRRFKLSSVILIGESRNADKDAASEFVDEFKDIISEGSYCPQHIFNCEELLTDNKDSFANEELIIIKHESVIDDINFKEESTNLERQKLLEVIDLADRLKQKVCDVEENKEIFEIFSSVLDTFMVKYKNKIQELN